MQKFLIRALCHPAYRRWRLTSALLLYGVIILLGAIPGARATVGEMAPGLILHAIAYATLTWLLFMGMTGVVSRRTIHTLLIISAMGASDEVIQSFFPYRTGSIGDWTIDVGAAGVMLLLLVLFKPKMR